MFNIQREERDTQREVEDEKQRAPVERERNLHRKAGVIRALQLHSPGIIQGGMKWHGVARCGIRCATRYTLSLINREHIPVHSMENGGQAGQGSVSDPLALLVNFACQSKCFADKFT